MYLTEIQHKIFTIWEVALPWVFVVFEQSNHNINARPLSYQNSY